jgi:hypothetical protein
MEKERPKSAWSVPKATKSGEEFKRAYEVPGPGNYEVDIRPNTPEWNFAARSDRKQLFAGPDTPGAGAYNVRGVLEGHPTYKQPKNTRLPPHPNPKQGHWHEVVLICQKPGFPKGRK